jgi:iron complex transport system substrate-binding protein
MDYNTPFRLTLLLVLLLATSISSCKKEDKKGQNDETFISTKYRVKYAKGFDIQYFKSYNKLIIKSPYPDSNKDLVYRLFKGTEISRDQDDLANTEATSIQIPLNKLVATSTTHIPMLEILGCGENLVGFPNTNYIASENARKRIDSGELTDIGKDMGLNTEMVIALQPEAVIGFALDDSDKAYSTLRKNDIPIVFNGDWLEETPLGRAEWIKFFGVLLDRNKEADSIFNLIEREYLDACAIAKKSKETPTIMSGILFKDQWNLPAGESFTAQLYKDANTNYLWKESEGQGSLVLNFETVLDRARDADFWIGSGIYTSRQDLLEANGHYSEFKAFEQNKIFTFSKKKGSGGGIVYFELGPLQPHIVLKDLIKVTHPDLLPGYEPFFLQPLD